MEAMAFAVPDRLPTVVDAAVDVVVAAEDLAVVDLVNARLIMAIPTVRCPVLGRRRGQNIGPELCIDWALLVWNLFSMNTTSQHVPDPDLYKSQRHP